jgi:hypothetical protein
MNEIYIKNSRLVASRVDCFKHQHHCGVEAVPGNTRGSSSELGSPCQGYTWDIHAKWRNGPTWCIWVPQEAKDSFLALRFVSRVDYSIAFVNIDHSSERHATHQQIRETLTCAEIVLFGGFVLMALFCHPDTQCWRLCSAYPCLQDIFTED